MKTSRFPFSFAPLIAFTLVCVIAGIAAAFPLTGSPGPEAAQILAVLGGPVIFFAGIVRGAQRKASGFIGDGMMHSALILLSFAVFLSIVTVVGWSNPSCAPGRGYLPLFLSALPVLSLAGVLGILIGRTFGSLKIAVGAGILLALVYASWVGLDWFWDPSFRVFTHLSLLVEGDLIRGRGFSAVAAAFRMATLCFVLALTCLGLARFPKETRVGLARTQGPHPALYILCVFFLLLGGIVHYQSKESVIKSGDALREAYSLERRRDRLILHADPLALNRDQADALLAEGALWMGRLKERMGVTPQNDIHIFFHKNKKTMAKWTGAENVHFALPGRHELHINRLEIPHPTLGHELAHALGSEIAGGLFGVPTDLYLFPKPGITEGLAMAVTPELEAPYGLTLREKAAALHKQELAPPFADLFEGLSFLGFWKHAPRNAYAVSGALIEAIAAERGTEGLKALYKEGELAAAFESKKDLQSFLQKYQTSLEEQELPRFAEAYVKRYFTKTSILSQTCDVDAEEQADLMRAEASRGDFGEAIRLAEAAEGGSLSGETLKALSDAALALGDKERAFEFLKKRSMLEVESPRQSASHQEGLADFLVVQKYFEEAATRYSAIETVELIPHEQRLIRAKKECALLASKGDRAAQSALRFLATIESADAAVALANLAEDVGESEGAVWPQYLLARQLIYRGDATRGLSMMLAVWKKRAQLPASFTAEIESAIAMGHGRRGDFAIAQTGFEQLSQDAQSKAQRVQFRDRLDRAQQALREKDREPGDVLRGDRHLLGLDARLRP